MSNLTHDPEIRIMGLFVLIKDFLHTFQYFDYIHLTPLIARSKNVQSHLIEFAYSNLSGLIHNPMKRGVSRCLMDMHMEQDLR